MKGKYRCHKSSLFCGLFLASNVIEWLPREYSLGFLQEMPKAIGGYLNTFSQTECLVNKTEIICLAEFSQDPPQ